MGIRRQWWMPFWLPLLPADKPTSIKHRGWYKYINFYINLLNLTKPFNSGLEKWMSKAARHSGGVVSSNPCRWRGKRLHHRSGGVCWLFVLLWMDLWCHKLIVCKKCYKNNLKMRLTALLFDPPRRAPHHQVTNSILQINYFSLVSTMVSCGFGPYHSLWLEYPNQVHRHHPHTIVDDMRLVWSDSLHITSSWLRNKGRNIVSGLRCNVWGVYQWRWGGWRKE